MRPAPLAHPSPVRVAVWATVALALCGFLATTAEARILRGTSRGDVLRGTNRADVIKGRAGNDRLYGRGGNDRLVGGPGKDRLVGGPGRDTLSCGAGRDIAIADRTDSVRGCEKVKLPPPSPAGSQGAPAAPAPPPAKPAPPPPPATVPPAADWTGTLIGSWYEQIGGSVWLYFFNDDPIAGLRTGSRAFCPNGNCALNPSPSPFAWVVDGDVLAIEFYTGTYVEFQILGYDAGTGTLTLNSSVGLTEWVVF